MRDNSMRDRDFQSLACRAVHHLIYVTGSSAIEANFDVAAGVSRW